MKLSPFRLAVLGWVIPATLGLFVVIVSWLDGVVPHPELAEAPPCFVDEQGETICPEPELVPPTTTRRIVSELAAEKVYAPLGLLALASGLVLSITVMVRTRASRKVSAEDKTAFRVALGAVLVLCLIPLIAGLVLFLLVASFQIRG